MGILTDSRIRKEKPGAKSRKLADGHGLYLLVNQTGKYWRWDYRHQDKRKTMALGVYPAVSLAQARKQHQEARAALASGVGPHGTEKSGHSACDDV